MKRRACFATQYDFRAKECQICEDSVLCWSSGSLEKSVTHNGYIIAILKIIAENKKATVQDIKEGLLKRFGKVELNIYYYLNLLKRSGQIDIKISGRQRNYTIR